MDYEIGHGFIFGERFPSVLAIDPSHPGTYSLMVKLNHHKW